MLTPVVAGGCWQGVLTQSTVDSELFLHLVSHSKRSSQVDQIFDAMTQVHFFPRPYQFASIY
jgi:hypothetical protein